MIQKNILIYDVKHDFELDKWTSIKTGPKSSYANYCVQRSDTVKEKWNKLPDTKRQHRDAVVGVYYAYSAIFVHGRTSLCTEFYDERAREWVITIDSGKEHHPMLQRQQYFQVNVAIIVSLGLFFKLLSAFVQMDRKTVRNFTAFKLK